MVSIRSSLWFAAALLLSACSDSTGPRTKEFGAFTIGVVFDGSPNTAGGGTMSFTLPDSNESRLVVTGEFAMPAIPNGTFTQFDDGTFIDGVVRFTVAGQSWQFEGTMTSDRRNVVGRHTRTSGGVTTSGGWSGTRTGGLPVPF
jgi:hypothetical protein